MYWKNVNNWIFQPGIQGPLGKKGVRGLDGESIIGLKGETGKKI